MMEEYNSHQVSSNLLSWTRGILREFDIELFAHVLTGNFDIGYDVKRCIEVVMALMQEWCVSHFYHFSLIIALSTHLNPVKCMNKKAWKSSLMSAWWWKRWISWRHWRMLLMQSPRTNFVILSSQKIYMRTDGCLMLLFCDLWVCTLRLWSHSHSLQNPPPPKGGAHPDHDQSQNTTCSKVSTTNAL